MKILSLYTALLATIVWGCSPDQPKQQVNQSPLKAGIQEPFRFHKAVEVKPGLTFDILSWGRGSEYVGAYLILRSDSARSKYRSTSGELEGKIVDAWNMDMDTDGNPEIFIQATSQDDGNYLNMYVYEFNDSGSANEIRFPELTSSTKKKYRGKDSLYIKEGELFREFPLYDEADTSANKPIGKKVLEYQLRGSTFSVKDISED